MIHPRYQQTIALNRSRFRRRTGIYPEVFADMLEALHDDTTVWAAVLVDVSDIPCERPKKIRNAGTAARKSATPGGLTKVMRSLERR